MNCLFVEKDVFYIAIYYRGHQWKDIAIYNATVVILHQKLLF
jgi:hypothetical protein